MYTISQFIEQLRGTPLGDTGTTIYDATLLRYISTLHSITEWQDRWTSTQFM